jgi:hypothetical protein
MSARRSVGVLAIIALVGCEQPRGRPFTGQAGDPPTADDAYSRQVGADVAAIVVGMALAHSVRAVWLMPAR